MIKHLCFLPLFLLMPNLQAQKATPYIGLADSLYQMGNYKAAINAYAKDKSAGAQLQIARAYHALGNSQKAIVQYQSIIKNQPEYTLAKFELGKLLGKTKKYEQAALLFEELVRIDNSNAEFQYFLGKTLQSNLDYESGNTALKNAIVLDSSHLKSIYLLGKYYVEVEEPSNALQVIEKGLRSAPDDVALVNLKALVNFNIGDYTKAAPLFERLIALGENKPFIYKKLGYSYFSTGNSKPAKTAYRALLDFTNYEADAYYGLAEVFLKEQQLDSAEIYMKKSMAKRRYVFDDEFRTLARIARLKKDTKTSLDYYKKAWKENPQNYRDYWQVCILADEYYQDPRTKLSYYERLLVDFKTLPDFLKERAQKRIKELKTEIHFKSN